MVRIKAQSVLDARKYVLEKYGPEGEEKVKAVISEEDRAIIYSENTLPVSWIDVNVVLRHFLAFDDVLGQGDLKVAHAMLREIANKQVTGIYSILLKSESPKEILKKISKIWERYYDKGKSSIEFTDDNHAVSKVTNCPDLPLHHEYLILPYMEELLRLSGAKNISARHTRCVAAGADCCVFEYRWD